MTDASSTEQASIAQPQRPDAGTVRWRAILLLCAAIVTIVVVALHSFAAAEPGNIDDAFIVLVYARHLVRDGQLYWNLADGPVEGYTSPLDVAVKAAGTALAPGDPMQAAFWSTVVLHVACALVVFWIVVRVARDLRWRYFIAFGAAVGVASNPSLAYGSSFLLETPLFVVCALAVIGSMLVAQGPLSITRLAAFVLLLTALSLARPEGLPISMCSLAVLCVQHRQTTPLRRLALAIAWFSIAVAAFLIWRLTYFGEWAPNTYYAKTSSLRWQELRDGIDYVVQAFERPASALLLGVSLFGWVALLSRAWRSPTARMGYAACWLIAVVAIATVVWGGGDCYPDGRFLALPAIIAFLLLALGVTGLEGRARWFPLGTLVIALLLQVGGMSRTIDRAQIAMATWPVSEETFACEQQALSAIAAIDPSLAVAQSDCQRLKFYSDETYVVDLHGLNDRSIAHQPAYRRVLWGRYQHDTALNVGAPVWVWGFRWLSPYPITSVRLSQLLSDQRLVHIFSGFEHVPKPATAARIAREYVPASVPACDLYLNFLVRKEHAAAFRRAGVSIGD